MGQKTMLSIVVSMLCYNAMAYQEPIAYCDQIRTTTAIGKPNSHGAQHDCTTCNDSNNDKEVAEKAIATLASMATSILNMGTAAHDPAIIGTNVINILSSFVNFVTFALKNPGVAELLNDELFQDALRRSIVRSIVSRQSDIPEAIL